MGASPAVLGVKRDADPRMTVAEMPSSPPESAAGDDAGLVRRAAAGDAGAFGALVDRHERAALAVAYAVTGRAASAADAVQEACLRAWRKRATLAEPDKFRPWLLHIVRRCAVDLVRRSGRERPTPDGDLPAPTPADPLLRRERHDAVRAALDGLDEATRLALVLRFYDERSSREIADVLGCSPAAVDMRLKRGRDKLREVLKDHEAPF